MAISLSTLHPLFAAQVSGVDPSRPIDPSDWAAIEDALGKYGVLVFKGPTLTPEEQVAFASHFGPLESQNGVLTTGRSAASGSVLAAERVKGAGAELAGGVTAEVTR